jgi:hypothetical protein
MQTCRQTWLEVGIDTGLAVMVNIGAQLLAYGALATAARSLLFATLVFGLAIPRRYTTRRLFNARLTNGAPQTRRQAWLEIGMDTLIGFCVAVVLQWLIYGAAATWAKAGGLTMVLYAMTLARRYLLRRLFESWSTRQRVQTLYGRQLSSSCVPNEPLV